MLPAERRTASGARDAAFARACLLAVAFAGTAPAQKPLPESSAVVPSITLLLREPRGLEVARTRRLLSRGLGVELAAEESPRGDYVVAAGENLVGRSAGVAWRIESEPKARSLDAASTRHLMWSRVEELAEHAAQLHVRCVNPCTGDAETRTAYRALAGVAAALLARDVMGVGTAHHGTFEPCTGDLDSWRRRLRGDDPLHALRPVQDTSLVLFLRAPRPFAAPDVAAAFAREWKRPFGSGTDKDPAEFVVAADGGLMAMVSEQLLAIEARLEEEPTAEELEGYQELRMRFVMEKRRQVLRLHVAGEATPEAEAARRRLVARAAASLWGEDVLAVSWHCDRRLAYPHDGLQEALRADDPVAASLVQADVPVVEAPDEAAMQAAMEKARAEWPKAKARVEAGSVVFAKFPFPTRAKGVEHMWIRVTRVVGKRVHGVLENNPVDVEGLRLGSEVVRETTDLGDWLFEVDGVRVGGFTVELLTRKPAKRAAGGK